MCLAPMEFDRGTWIVLHVGKGEITVWVLMTGWGGVVMLTIGS